MSTADAGACGDSQSDLLVSGFVRSESQPAQLIEVRRDMQVLTCEGQAAGRVAAVLINRHNRQVTHLLLTCHIQPPEYRLVPVALVDHVQEEHVLLHISRQSVEGLVLWHG